jgi:amino acid adenylation domain-containing protein
MTSPGEDGDLAELVSLGPAQWPWLAAHGRALGAARARLSVPPGPHLDRLPADALAAALTARFDVLGLAVTAVPGLAMPVLRPGADLPWPGAPVPDGASGVWRTARDGAGGLEIDAPAALMDGESWRLVWSWLRNAAAAGLDGPAGRDDEEVGFLDVAEWQREVAERHQPGSYDAALAAVLAGQAGTAPIGYDWHSCGDLVAALVAEVPGDAEDVLAAALALALPGAADGRAAGSNAADGSATGSSAIGSSAADGSTTGSNAADGTMTVWRLLHGRFTTGLRRVAGRLDLLAPVPVTIVPGPARELTAAIAEQAARAQQDFERDPVAVAEAACRWAGAARPAVAVVREVVLPPLAAPDGGVSVRPRLTDNPGPADILVQIGSDGAAVSLRHAAGRPLLPPALLEERLVTVLRRLAGPPRRSGPASGRPGGAELSCPPGERERQWLRGRLRGEGLPGPLRPVPEIVLGHGTSAPERCALRTPDGSLTYGELRGAVLGTAARLRARGVRPGDLVAVSTGRLAPLSIAALAAMTCGAAWLPLDPDVPAQRREQLLRQSGAQIVLTGPDAPGPAPHWPAVPVAGTEAAGAEAGGPPGAPACAALVPVSLDAPAYAMFTSGSTGTPRLVSVPHRALAAYTAAIGQRLGLEPGMSCASPAALWTDLVLTTLWPPLAAGGTVVEIPPEARLDARCFGDIVTGDRVDVLKIPPSHLSALLQSAEPGRCLPRRTLILGGERIPPGLVERVRELSPSLTVINHYGPTEATVGVLAGPVPAALGPAGPPLGSALAHVAAAVVLPGDGDALIGQAGELAVAGPSLAHGYLGAPRPTAESFRPSRLGAPGGREYRTGDRVRVSPAGDIEFLGRLDDQVKVRGWRIEPGEVESVLREHPGVTQACVIAVDAAGGTALAGFAVTRPGVTEDDLLAHLRARLLEPFVPGRVEIADSLPLLPSGKVDRRRLRERAGDGSRVLTPARDDLELVVAAVWSDLIGVADVDVTINLFRAGAHSLLVTQALSRLRQLLGVPLQLGAFFEEPTIGRFAGHLAAGPDGQQARHRAATVAAALRMAGPDGAPPDGAPPDGAPRDGAPRDGAPRDGAPRDGAPRDGAPADGAPADGAPAGAPAREKRQPGGNP